MLELIEPAVARRMTEDEHSALVHIYGCLLRMRREAQKNGQNPRDFPLPLSFVSRPAGASKGTMAAGALADQVLCLEVILWLFYQGHVDHVWRTRNVDSTASRWSPKYSLRFDHFSALVLTDKGARFAVDFLGVRHAKGEGWHTSLKLMKSDRLAPQYDREGRIFRWGWHVLKQFRQPSENQILLLEGFEELQWPAWIDDPLPKVPGINRKVRLHDTIKHLNRNQKKYFIHFRGDGSAQRVGWEFHWG